MNYFIWVRFARLMETFGLILTSISSTIFLILTIFFVKNKVGSYKNLLIALPITGFLFALCQYLVDPFFHTYNRGFAFFRLTTFEGFSMRANTYALSSYVALYGSTISVLALQFVYRHWAVFRPRCIEYFFDGPRFILPLFYIFLICGLSATNDLILSERDSYAIGYLEKEILENYGVILSERAAFMVVVYDENGSVRWRNTVEIFIMTFIMVIGN
ncbi:unnamed protein product [Caenorhabditis nigoni]